MAESPKFEISVTAIIARRGPDGPRFLLTKRAATKKRFPNLWTVPGGHVEAQDYQNLTHNVDGVAYKVLEHAVAREVREETGLFVTNFRYLTSMELDHGKVVVISMLADYCRGEVTLDPSEATEYKWATLGDAKALPLIAGIFEELLEAHHILNCETLNAR